MTLKKVVFASMVLSCGGIAACSTPTEITTQDGQKTMTADKPKIDSKEGFITYEKDGKEVKVNTNNVKSIEEVK